MDIGSAWRKLGAVDIAALGAAILAQGEQAWREDDTRQRSFEVHRQTESMILLFCDGWPDLMVSRHAGWKRLGAAAQPVMDALLQRGYAPGGRIIRAMAAKLLSGGRINPHKDSHPSFAIGHRIHVPITTNPGVRFMIDGRPYRMEVGEAYEINNQMTHSVINLGKENRITFIFDYVPPDKEPAPT